MNLRLAMVDTDVVSFIANSHPAADAYVAVLKDRDLAVSVVTLAEIEFGMKIRSWGPARRSRVHRVLFEFTPIPIDAEIAREWATVRALCHRKGRKIATNDAWIAATARHLNLPLATHNRRDFEIVDGLELLRPPA